MDKGTRAIAHIEPLSPTLGQLTAEYQAYCDANELPHMSADELICETLTDAQRAWVSQFINRWEAAAKVAVSAPRH